MKMTKREFTNLAKRLAKEYWGITLNIPIKWEEKKSNRNYATFHYKYIRDQRTRKVIGHEPLYIIFNTKTVSTFTDEQLIDILKHELTHWAGCVMKKPFSDGTVWFEKELLRIGATSTGFNQNDPQLQEKTVAYQQSVINPDVVTGQAEDVYPYRIYINGMEKHNWNGANWEDKKSWYHTYLMKYETFIRFTFKVDGEKYYGHIGYRNNKWSIAQTGTEVFYKEADGLKYGKKLKMDRKLAMDLREQMEEAANSTLMQLGY
jgi:hypothetical protein